MLLYSSHVAVLSHSINRIETQEERAHKMDDVGGIS